MLVAVVVTVDVADVVAVVLGVVVPVEDGVVLLDVESEVVGLVVWDVVRLDVGVDVQDVVGVLVGVVLWLDVIVVLGVVDRVVVGVDLLPLYIYLFIKTCSPLCRTPSVWATFSILHGVCMYGITHLITATTSQNRKCGFKQLNVGGNGAVRVRLRQSFQYFTLVVWKHTTCKAKLPYMTGW